MSRSELPWLATIAAVLLGSACVADGNESSYGSCETDRDCGGDHPICQPVVVSWPEGTSEGSFCTRACVDSEECMVSRSGTDGTCVSFGRARFACYESCASRADCDATQDCASVGDVSVCAPRGFDGS